MMVALHWGMDFNRIYAEHAEPLREFIDKRFSVDTEAVLQDTLAAAWIGWDKYDPNRPLRAWLFIIAKRTAINSFTRPRPFSGLAVEPAAPIAKQIDEGLLFAVDTLAPELRQPIRLIYLDGRTYREAADQLGLSLGTLKTRVNRALRKLRVALQPELDREKSTAA